MKAVLATLFAVAALLWLVPSPVAAQIPDQAYISSFVGRAQTYSLSCESRSAADWGAYWGVYIDETEFLNRLPRSDDPNKGFVGDVNGPWGYIPPAAYGVHAAPVAELLREYGLDAQAETGLRWDDLRAEIAAGRPAIVWVIGTVWAGTPRDYTTKAGDTVTVANNQHSMVLIGYDESRVHLVDALTGYTITHPLQNFLASWSVLGNMAVIGEGSGQLPAERQPSNASGSTYTVQSGDTLNRVANRFNLYWPDLAALNGISYPYLIYTGQVLLLSADAQSEEPLEENEPDVEEPQTYTVQRGDYLLKVAETLELDWLALARANGLLPPFDLHAGDVLQLPEEDAEWPAAQPPASYTATRSESLVMIAQFYGLDWLRLAGHNNIAFPYLLAPGQNITLD
ncbi:MAG: LysM peptidoglycan-binding domain-containing protein [Anaerolineales bacterium]|nr:LysM peptidoglycan-binding domain-containing protein [Anaerolineales bacterium]MCW5856554.1 LysM peptidoglycan-binding domain-containing protein [Anaerolineales bacterium]